jgi:hypothetical protein
VSRRQGRGEVRTRGADLSAGFSLFCSWMGFLYVSGSFLPFMMLLDGAWVLLLVATGLWFAGTKVTLLWVADNCK